MQWLIPLFVFLLAFFFWRLSMRTDDGVAAWLRASFAVVLAMIAVAVSAGIALR